MKNVIFLSTILMNHNEQKTSILTKEKTTCGGKRLPWEPKMADFIWISVGETEWAPSTGVEDPDGCSS